MKDKSTDKSNEISDEALETSIVDGLFVRYDESKSNSYLGSSKELLKTAKVLSAYFGDCDQVFRFNPIT